MENALQIAGATIASKLLTKLLHIVPWRSAGWEGLFTFLHKLSTRCPDPEILVKVTMNCNDDDDGDNDLGVWVK